MGYQNSSAFTNKSVSITGLGNYNSEETPKVAAAMAAAFTAVVNDRLKYFREYEKMRGYYLVDALISNISEDALTPDITTNDILQLSSENPKIKSALEKFQTKFDIDSIVSDITPDLLENGEYPLKITIKKGEGITEISDTLNHADVLAFYDQGYPTKFLVKRDKNLELWEPTQLVHFIINRRKIRISRDSTIDNLNNNFSSDVVKSIPAYVRVGRPLFYGVLSKIKELQLLEALVPGLKLNAITQGSIATIDVPPSTDPKQAFEIAREYENLFNKKIALNQESGQLTATDILTVAGRTKVIPTFGNKGGLQNTDLRNNSDVSDITNSIRDIRDVICTSVGFPAELLFGGSSKSEMLKKYARYFRKVKNIQQSISTGLVQLALAHLNNLDEFKGSTIQPRDIQVQFLNELVNIDELEKLEYQDTLLSMLKNTIEFTQNLSESPELNDLVRSGGLKNFISRYVDFINYDSNNRSGDDDRPITFSDSSE